MPKEFPELKQPIFMGGGVLSVRRDFGQLRSRASRKFDIFWCSDWPKIVILFHSIACSFENNVAHHRSLLQEAASTAEDASRAAVHVESSGTMRSRKAQRQTPPDNSETGDICEYHSRERSCAGEKIQHQNV